jgi:hypothetical protein
MGESLKCASYPLQWFRIEQCLLPLGPFNRSKFYELLKAGAFEIKRLKVGHGKRAMTLISVDSVNKFLDGPGLAVGPMPRKLKTATKRGSSRRTRSGRARRGPAG